MPKNTTPTRKQLQARIKRSQDAIIRKQLRKEHYARVRKEVIKAQRITLRNALKWSKGKGIYEPKSLELTKYRKSRARKVIKEYGPFIDVKKYFFVQAPKARRVEVIQRAEGLKLKATHTGIFIAREGHTKARFKESKKYKELYIERSGRTKRGPSRGRRYTHVTPITSVDELETAKDRLKDLAASLPIRNKNERLAFKTKSNGVDGYSHATFADVGLLLEWLENYKMSLANRIQFYRDIEIERVETSVEWFKEHPARSSRERRAILRRSKGKPSRMARQH